MNVGSRTYAIPPYLDYEAIRARASASLVRAGWSGALPIPVENLMDVGLGLNIVSEPFVKEHTEAEGFLSRDRKTVYLHDYMVEWLQNRMRFTLAHEWGHYELHRELYEVAEFQDFEEWRVWINGMPPELRLRYEAQANHFAGLILVPREEFTRVLNVARRRVRGPFVEIELRDDEERGAVVGEVARRFLVSGDVIDKRGRLEALW